MDAEVIDAGRSARAIIKGRTASAEELKKVAARLRSEGRKALVAELLTTVARAALKDRPDPDEHGQLAGVLRDHQQFGLAWRLLERVRSEGPDSEALRQQHAFCTYKDLGLSAARRFDRALEILGSGGSLERSTDAETLGLAGAIYKRRWEVDAKSADLENAYWCYRRGFAQERHEQRLYAGINAAFVADRLAGMKTETLGGADAAVELRRQADEIRTKITDMPAVGDRWTDATIGEALFGLGDFEGARERLTAAAAKTENLWELETTATQLATLAGLRKFADDPRAQAALGSLLKGSSAALRRVSTGKIGLALSGGGFRASLFHIGVLARLAECNVLRRVEVLSCVSGGSIVGAYYYLKLRELLQETPDAEITDLAYVELVRQVAVEFLAGVRRNLRGKLARNVPDDARMLLTKYSLSDRAGELFEQFFYGPLRKEPGPWRMTDLLITPAGSGDGFTLQYENWMREAKVPVLVLNATTLNTGHSWQFTATWMGEPPSMLDEQMDASRRLRRVYYRDAPDVDDLRRPTLGKAVAASACVPGPFAPITISGLYEGDIDVELVDGGVHDNQGIASLLEQDCTVLLVSDASGQLRDAEDPKRGPFSVLKRSNDVLMKRVRGAQYGELLGRVRAGTLRGFLGVHLTKGLLAGPRRWKSDPTLSQPFDEPDGEAASPYDIDPVVQRALSELRTDLDVFSDDEAFALMAAGYQMTKVDLGKALPGQDIAGQGLELGARWPFWRTLTEMTSSDATRLAHSLRWGHVLFFRKQRVWFDRLRARASSIVRPNARNP